jgi:NitT/TauT family transport system ATP-binding protein
MQNLLINISASVKCAVLLVTHDIREALMLSDTILLMSQRPGRILDSFTLEQPKPRSRSSLSTAPLGDFYDEIIAKFPLHL